MCESEIKSPFNPLTTALCCIFTERDVIQKSIFNTVPVNSAESEPSNIQLTADVQNLQFTVQSETSALSVEQVSVSSGLTEDKTGIILLAFNNYISHEALTVLLCAHGQKTCVLVSHCADHH